MNELSDNDLIELAAQAYGFTWKKNKDGSISLTCPDGNTEKCCKDWHYFDSTTGNKLDEPKLIDALNDYPWEPFDSFRSAIHLATKLNMKIYFSSNEIKVLANEVTVCREIKLKNYYSETCRAIVFCAAQIQLNKKVEK
jgi:hypothetical protein